jgi:8-amino-7-oxononanoate synthase
VNGLLKVATWLAARPSLHTTLDTSTLPCPHFVCEGKRYVSFSSNNYLGLACHPRLINAARNGFQLGVANCESRLLTGDLQIYRELEMKLAAVKKKQAALLFATGYLTNLGVLSALVRWPIMARVYGYRAKTGSFTYFSDERNHISIKEGIRLSGATEIVYRHCDVTDLAKKLANHSANTRVIVTDGVFSQDGDIAPLPDLLDLAERYDAAVYIDDAHGTGVLGASGNGTSEHFDVESSRLIQMGTLSKAYGSIGGFLAADRHIVEILRMSSYAYGFTSTLPPDQALAVSEAIDVVADEPQLRAALWDNQRHFITHSQRLGLPVMVASTPIVPVLVGGERECDRVSEALRREGVHVDAVKFPAVPLNQSRLRVMLNAAHTKADIDRLLALLQWELKAQAACRDRTTVG